MDIHHSITSILQYPTTPLLLRYYSLWIPQPECFELGGDVAAIHAREIRGFADVVVKPFQQL